MAQYLPLPDGSFVTVREGEQPADAWERAQREYPAAFGIDPKQTAPAGPAPEGGFVPAFKAGAQRLIGQGALTAGKVGLLDTAEAERINAEREARARQIFQPTDKSFLEAPLQNVAELAGGSAPYMLAPLAVGAGAALGGAPAAVGLGAAGLTSFGQFVGSNLGRQVDEGKSLEQASGTQAVAAAIPQAALDMVGFRFIPGIGRLFGAAGQRITAETAQQLANQTVRQVAADYVQAAGKAATVEGLTEAVQQSLERAQAELALLDPEARKEYLDSFIGGAVLGGALGAPGRGFERSRMKRESEDLQAEQARVAAEQEAQRAQQEAAAQQQRMAVEANPREMGPQLEAGAQQMIPGVDAYTPPTPAASPEQQLADLRQEQEQLRTLVRNSDDLYRMERERLQRGQFGGPSAVQQVQAAQKRLKEIDAELAKRGIQAFDAQGSVAQRLRKAQEELQALANADENAYDPEQVDKLKRRIAKLQAEAEGEGGAQDAITPDLFGTINVNERTVGRNVEADRARVGQEAGAQRESLTQRRAQIEQEIAALRRMSEGNPNDPTAAANLRRALQAERDLGREIAAMEQQAAGTATAVEQPRLFGEPEGMDRVGTGTAGTARSEAQILTDIDIAKAARERERVNDLVSELRALRDANRTRERESKAGQTDVSQLGDRELERVSGMRVPEQTAQRQAATDARYRAFGQMVSTLDRFNKGRADADALRNAERQVADNLVGEIELLRGQPLAPAERSDVLRELRPLLEDLKSRFGDTRNVVNMGTRKEPEMERVQNERGDFRRDLPGAGAGPTGMGLENQESRRPGDRTFSNRYAAAQSILEGIDQIRNRMAGQQETAPGVDRNDSNRPVEQRLDDALRGAQARATPEQRRLLDQIDANREQVLRARTSGTAEKAIELGTRINRGRDTTDLERELADDLRLISEAQQTEDTRQGDLVGGRGTVFNSYQELEEYLASDALQALKLANGQTKETLARATKMVEPLRKRAAELEKKLQGLLKQKADLVELNQLERAVSDSQVADGEAAVAKATSDLEFAVSDYREALLESQMKLQAALDEDARIAREIADNAELIRTQIRDAQTEVIGLSREVAKAQEAFDRHSAAIANSADPLSRPKLAELNRLQSNLASLQQKMRERSTRAAQLSGNPPSSNRAERMRAQIRDAQTEVIGLSRELAKAKEALAKHAATLFSSADPLSRPKLAKYNELEAAVVALQQKLVERSNRAAQLSGNPPSSDTLLEFQRRATELVQQRRQQSRVIGGLTSARNRAQRVLDQANQAALADPELAARLQSARDVLATARSLQGNAAANIAQRERQIVGMQPEIDATGDQVQALRRMAEERAPSRQRPPATPPAAITQERGGQAAREAADARRRQEEQRTLETRQQGPGTDRESVSFEMRRAREAALEEAQRKVDELELDVADGLATPEQLAKAKRRVATLEDEAAGRTRGAQGMFNVQARDTQALEKTREKLAEERTKLAGRQERLSKLREGTTAYANMQTSVGRLQAAVQQLESRVETLETNIAARAARISAFREGITRTRVGENVERRLPANAEERIAEIAETQTRARTTSPATRETRVGGGLRTGDPETGEQRAGAQRTRIVERTLPPAGRRAVSAKDIAEANAIAQTIEESKKAAAEANAAAERIRNEPKQAKMARAEQAAKVVEKLAKTKKTKPARTSYVQDVIDAMEDGGDDFEPALFREDNAFYESRATTDLSENAAEAAFDGRILDVVDDIAQTSKNPVHRRVAQALRPMLLRTKLNVQDGPVIHDGKAAEGIYLPGRNTIEISALAMSEETFLHEAVHAATLRALSGQVQLSPAQQQALADLQALYETMKQDPAFSREYAGKNLAEFVSEVMSNQQVRDKIDAAQGRGFLDRLYNGILRLLGIRASDKAVNDALALFTPSRSFNYQYSGVASVMRGVFPATKPAFTGVPEDVRALSGKIVGRNPTMRDKIMANVNGLAFRTQFLDRFAPVDVLLEKGVQRGMISDAQALQTSYFLRFGEQRNQFVEQAATTGVPQLRKNKDGEHMIETPDGDHPNLAKIAQVLSKAGVGNEQATEELFTTYLAVKRGEQVGFNKLNYDGAVTPADAAKINAFVNANPAAKAAFEEARKLYRAYNNDLLDLMVQTGAMTKNKAAELKQGDYVPYYRQDANGVVNLIVAGEQPIRIGNIKDQPYLEELVGGNEKILPFFSGAMQNTSLLIDMALRNKQMMEVAALLQNLGLARPLAGAGTRGRNVLQYTINGDPVHMVLTDAVDAFGVPADLLVKGLEGIKTTLPVALRLLQYPTNILRTFITRSPAYAIRQLVREPINAWLVSGANFTPVVSSVAALKDVLTNKSAAATALERTGAISSNVFTGDIQDQARIMRDVQAGKTPWQKVMAAADKMAVGSDTATRAVLYDKYRKQGMTHMQAVMATLETMNFSRRGLSPTMQMMSMLVPFFNAQVQGIDVIYRSLTGKSPMEQRLDVQRKLFVRGLGITAATLAYAALMQDDEAYKNATPEQRALNWFLPLPGFDEPLRVPIPFELGYLFKALPELALNTAFGDTEAGDAAKTIGRLAWQTVPIGIPQALKPALEVATNYSFFTGSGVETTRERGMQTEARMRDNTTELSKMLGSAGVLSPVQIDYLIRGYTGGLGLTLVGLASNPLKLLQPADMPEMPTKNTSQLPFIGALFQPVDGRAAIDAAYEDIQSWQQAHNTFQSLVQQGRRAEAMQFAQRFSNELALNSTGGAFRQQMGELAALRRAVVARTDLTPAQKREQVDRIRQVELTLARRIRELNARAS